MSVFIAGSGWVTPLGNGVPEVWKRLLEGNQAAAESISDPVAQKDYPVFRVPETALQNLPRHPRLRRASAISRFAAAAGLAALEDARSTIGSIDPKRTALVFGVANGGVTYTRKFYHEIVSAGAQAASPLLFPETVFNAPASHLAAILGIDGASYTVVADGAVGILAIQMAENLMASSAFDSCLVVAAEEADWVLCDAYQKWRLLRRGPPIELFEARPRGTILSEGAGAILIARTGPVEIEMTHPGMYFTRRSQAAGLLKRIVEELAMPEIDAVISSANGTFIDNMEMQSVSGALPEARIYSCKEALGESVGASGLWQVIVAAQAVRTKELPRLVHGPANRPQLNRDGSLDRALVINCGLNQQAAGLRLRHSSGQK